MSNLKCVIRSLSIGCVVLLAVGVVGCAPDIEQDPPPEPRVSTILDSGAGVIPLPNNAALESDGTLPPQPGAGEENAQGYFLSYLDTIHGWLTITPIEIPFDGQLDSESVTTDSVRLYRFPEDDSAQPERLEVASVSVSEETFELTDDEAESEGGTRQVDGSMLTVTPAEPLQRDTRYGYVVTDSITGADGRETVPAQPMFFALSPGPLVDDNDESTIESLTDAQANQLEGLRQLTAPVVETATSGDLDRDSIVAASVWTTFSDTLAVFDIAGGDIPFPNDFVRRGEGGTVSLPVPDDPSQLEQMLFGELNTRTGFSTVAPGWMRFDGPIDTDSLDSDSFLSMSAYTQETGLYPTDKYDTRYLSETSHLIIEPTTPLRPDRSLDPVTPTGSNFALNLWAVTSDLQAPDGRSVKPSPTFVFLRSPYPLVDEQGNSLVSLLADSQAQQLEAARQLYDTFIETANSAPVVLGLPSDFELPRDQIVTAFFAHPSNPTQDAREWRARGLDELGDSPAATRATGATCTGGGSADCEVNPADLDNVQIVQRAAEMETVSYLQQDGSLDAENSSRSPVGLSVYVPKRENDCSSVTEFPVAIVQHGLTGWRGDMSGVADALAADCVATVAMDFVGHGGRTPGTSDLHPDTKPVASGQTFISQDLVRTKGHFLQSFVDLSVLAEYIASDGLESAIDDDGSTNYFDYGSGADTDIGYAGQSLGGIVGTSFTTIDDETTVGVYNVAGGKLSRILSEGALGGPIIDALRDAGIDEGTFEEVRALAFIQWIAEPVDPVAFAPFITGGNLPELGFNMQGDFVGVGSLPENEVLVQMATGDPIVPNGATEALVRAMGRSIDSLADTTFSASHGFLTEENPPADSAADCARRQIGAWISNGLGVGGSSEAQLPSDLTASNCVMSSQ